MNTNLVLKSLQKINNAAKTIAILKQDAYNKKAHLLCGAYKIEQNCLYTLKTLVMQQLVSDGVLKRLNNVLVLKDGFRLLPEFSTKDAVFCFRSNIEGEEIKDEKAYCENKDCAECYYYKPYERYLTKYLSGENKEIYKLLCECYDACVRDRMDYTYLKNDCGIVKILNTLIEKFNMDFKIYSKYIGDGATEYTIDIYKDGYLLSSSIYLIDNQEDFGQCFFALNGKLYYGNSQWHNDVKIALVDEEDIEGYEIDVEKTEFYENCIIFRYGNEYEEIVYYNNYRRCELE